MRLVYVALSGVSSRTVDQVTEHSDWLSPTERQAWLGFRRMTAVVNARVAQDLLRDSGLSESDYDVLSTLTERDDCRWCIPEFARRLSWSQSRLSHHLSRMAGRGLVQRTRCPSDSRSTDVLLSAKGAAVLREAAPRHVASVRKHFIDALTPPERETLALMALKVGVPTGPETASEADEPPEGK